MKKSVIVLLLSLVLVIVGTVITVGEAASIQYVTKETKGERIEDHEIVPDKYSQINLSDGFNDGIDYKYIQFNLEEDKSLQDNELVFEYSDSLNLFKGDFVYEDDIDEKEEKIEQKLCLNYGVEFNGFDSNDNSFENVMKALKDRKFVKYELSKEDKVINVRYAPNLKEKLYY